MVQGNEAKNYNPSKLERRLLVWYKKYPSMKEVPPVVSLAVMEKVKNKARIHINLAMVGVFSVAFFFTARAGKRNAREGASIEKLNIDWHNQYNDPGNVNRELPDIRRS